MECFFESDIFDNGFFEKVESEYGVVYFVNISCKGIIVFLDDNGVK